MHVKTQKEDREFVAPLREVQEPIAPFQVTFMDITQPYFMTPHRNQYLLTFIDCITEIVEAKTTLTRVCEVTLKGPLWGRDQV